MMVKNLRRISQGIFLLIFLWLFLQTESKGADELGYPVKIFLDADPLIFITTFLSARSLDHVPYLAIVVIIATAFLGRVFCGWLCPLGTLNNMVGSLKKWRFASVPLNWHRLKYYIFIFLLVASLFSLQLVGIVDPLSLLIRSLSIAVYPLISHAAVATFDAVYGLNVPFFVGISEAIYSFLKKVLLPFKQPFFLQSVFVGLLFFLILGLNLLEKRFWCKYLCPLGAFLGLLSRYALLKRSVAEGCDSCGACGSVCQGGAVSHENKGWKNTECLLCMNCDDLCPNNAVRFGFTKKAPAASMDLGRRRVAGSIVAGIVAAPLVKVSPVGKTTYRDSKLIRPPGSLDERQFLNRCVKCGECMKVCITNGLQPTFLEAGIEGIWSPVLVPRIGYCEYRCTLCGQVCPTGAIKKLSPEEKANVKIGLAMIDKGRCLPFAHGTPCIVCEEVCPTPKKAIWYEEVMVRTREGKQQALKQPHVDLALCIGCGICETKCPVLGQPAIYVTSIGESRSKDNQLLLP
jgi:polyferredoxin/formate hydrogenlyase subunit 6/NADH:ubiquinone oxidoreductase subunit I